LENKSTADKILNLIKRNTRVTAALVAETLSITKEGARQHLLKLENSQLIIGAAKSEGVGRPITYYSLTEKGLAKFPDAHAQVTVELLNSVKHLLGENALDLLITDREQQTYKRYEEALNRYSTIESRLERLAQLRTDEGYMAEWKKDEDVYYLIENHCPICAAATECQGFCRAELKNFRQLIGDEYHMERVKHIIKGENRCSYKIIPK
jgi:predicted ArsR family transcriptional regulator